MWIIFLFVLVPINLDVIETAYCGTSTIPYSFEVLNDGDPILGCARPCCFGREPNTGRWATEDSEFLWINGRFDGFLRDELESGRATVPTAQTAICAGSPRCGLDQWAGGFYRLEDGRFFMICCTFFPLNQAQYLGVATVHPGEIYSGGETPDGQFDYIRNVVPISYSNGSVVGYELEIGRFGCPCREAEEVQPVYSPPYFMPSYGYGGMSACFPADSNVILHNGEVKRMDEVSLQDAPLSPNVTMDRIVYTVMKSWLHRLPEQDMEFLVITTRSGKRLKITEQHYLFKADCHSGEAIKSTADAIFPGDCLLEMDNYTFLKPVEVIKVKKIIQKGIFAPLTDTGMLIVDGIAVSCYSEMDNEPLITTLIGTFVSCEEEQCDISHFGKDLLLSLAQLVLGDLSW